jgi:hypothetical protein
LPASGSRRAARASAPTRSGGASTARLPASGSRRAAAASATAGAPRATVTARCAAAGAGAVAAARATVAAAGCDQSRDRDAPDRVAEGTPLNSNGEHRAMSEAGGVPGRDGPGGRQSPWPRGLYLFRFLTAVGS